MDEQNLLVRQGWQCPICHRVYSPDTTMCYFCGNETRTNFATSMFGTGINEDVLNAFTKQMQEGE